ncbi:MAG: DUF456 domain-containing protein [Bacteroidales bacterium]|nr:DUF456 domain-containing protein [Bacteroidales bacterium]
MNTILIILAFVLLLASIVCVFTPVPPAVPVAWTGLLLARLSDYADIGTALLVWSAVVGVLLMALDYVIPLLTTRRFGGTKWGVWGCTIGLLVAMVGLPFGPTGLVGVFFWPFVGAFVGEYIKQQEVRPALKSAYGSFIGIMTGSLAKIVYALVLIVLVIVRLF